MGVVVRFAENRGDVRKPVFSSFITSFRMREVAKTSVENLELRCRAHNVYEAEQQFGRGQSDFWARESRAQYCVDLATRSGPSLARL
jgi:hypothetical protein